MHRSCRPIVSLWKLCWRQPGDVKRSFHLRTHRKQRGKVVTMNPYAPPTEEAMLGIASRSVRWHVRTRLKLFVGFAITSLILTFGFFHGFFVLFWGDLQPFGFDIAHRYMITFVGIGLPIQCLFSAVAFNRRMGWVMAVCNCVVLAPQLYCVYELIRAVASGP